jgi:hypothetical protein
VRSRVEPTKEGSISDGAGRTAQQTDPTKGQRRSIQRDIEKKMSAMHSLEERSVRCLVHGMATHNESGVVGDDVAARCRTTRWWRDPKERSGGAIQAKMEISMRRGSRRSKKLREEEPIMICQRSAKKKS